MARGRRRACATPPARRSSPICWAARRQRPRRRPACSTWRPPLSPTSPRCELELVAQLFDVLRARVRVLREVAVEQLRELLHLRRAQLLEPGFRRRRILLRARGLRALLRAVGLRAGLLHLAAAGGLVLAIGLGRLLGLGRDLFLDLRLALLLAALGLAVTRAAALRPLRAGAGVVRLVAETAALVLLGCGEAAAQQQDERQHRRRQPEKL